MIHAAGTADADDALAPFDLTGALPTGTVVLEASAGTGKTTTIAALATRYVAEWGLPISELLLVTFTRAATAELGDRVRSRLVDAADHLEARLSGTADPSADALLHHLADAPVEEVRARQRRLARAVTAFDTATISTIHGFCQQMLRTLGLATDTGRDLEVVPDQDELLASVVADLLVGDFHDHAGAPSAARAHAAARAAVHAPDATVLPVADPVVLPAWDVLDGQGAVEDPEQAGARLAHLARHARRELAVRKRRAGLLSQDDLLVRLRDAVADPAVGATAVAVLRDRVRIALVDEFQDTDPAQWQILSRAFATPGAHRALVLIGDPKQAIYRFRGADVRAYLEAIRHADVRTSLTTNWRSDAPLVAALNHLFAGTTFGETDIVHRRVVPAPSRAEAAITAREPTHAAPLELRVVTGVGSSGAAPTATSVRHALLADDVAAEVVRTLQDRDIRIDGRPVAPGDLAVLVRANTDATSIQRALRTADVPAVVNGVGNVLASEAAGDWQCLLDALHRPASAGPARRLVLTASFGGWDGHQLAEADDDAWDIVHERLHGWEGILRRRGVTAVLRGIAQATDLPARVLARAGGERLLTDLHHVAELLDRARADDDVATASLASWLRERRADARDSEVPVDALARRLESDAEAVQILTVHKSKGLEFPIVFCPYGWVVNDRVEPPVTVHDPAAASRVVDVGPGDRDGFANSAALERAARRGEDLRLLYVALTRARHRVVAWWVPTRDARKSALGRVLFARDTTGVTDRQPDPPDRAEVVGALRPLLARLGGVVSEVPAVVGPSRYLPPARPTALLTAARLTGTIDRRWRRTSFSSLTAGVGHPMSGHGATDPDPTDSDDGTTKDDEALHAAVAVPGAPTGSHVDDRGRPLNDQPLPLAGVPGSAEFGTMVHAVLERMDFASGDLAGELDHHLGVEVGRAGLDVDRHSVLDGLLAALTTPLGPIAAGRALCDLPRSHRMDEPRFELPLAGGDTDPGRPAFALASVADLLRHHLPADDPLAAYHRRLHDPALRVEVRGYLNGAIDLVARVQDDDAPDLEPRFVIIDYKTNRLGWPDVPTSVHYRPAALATAMMDAHYPLQALLYTVALHRMLRWRLPGYEPDRHLGGCAYLFLRGMTGTDVPHMDGHPCGVFSWRPPTGLVLDLDALLAGRPVPSARVVRR